MQQFVPSKWSTCCNRSVDRMAKGVRREGRELALKAIYCFAQGGVPDVDAHLRAFWGNFHFEDGPLGEAVEDGVVIPRAEVRAFSDLLIRGIAENLPRIDSLIAEYATNWSIDRMARVDLGLLRLATFELLFQTDTPHRVVINEAIEVGKRFGSKETPAFINGILDKLATVLRSE